MCGEAQREPEWRLRCTNTASNHPSLWICFFQYTLSVHEAVGHVTLPINGVSNVSMLQYCLGAITFTVNVTACKL